MWYLQLKVSRLKRDTVACSSWEVLGKQHPASSFAPKTPCWWPGGCWGVCCRAAHFISLLPHPCLPSHFLTLWLCWWRPGRRFCLSLGDGFQAPGLFWGRGTCWYISFHYFPCKSFYMLLLYCLGSWGGGQTYTMGAGTARLRTCWSTMSFPPRGARPADGCRSTSIIVGDDDNWKVTARLPEVVWL